MTARKRQAWRTLFPCPVKDAITKALVTVRQSRCSVPVGLVGLRVEAQIRAREVILSHRGREVARHQRSYERLQVVARLDHYLDLLRERPGALAGSLALHQERARGALDRLWAALAARYGDSEAARHMVEVLLLAREVGPEAMIAAVAGALAAAAHDGRAVALLAGGRPGAFSARESGHRRSRSARFACSTGIY
ncbi:MAG: Mu transposase domain-containing protein [Gaiella sp.]